MKKFNLSILALFIVGFLSAQGKYEAGMNQAFELWTSSKKGESIALFERIGKAANDNWIPIYHAANFLIVESFETEDKKLRFEKLKKAEGLISEAHKRSPDNSEILTLEGMLYTGYVAADPGQYGMAYSQKIMELHYNAIKLNPDNPRAKANSVQFEMGTARFFGEDMAPYCKKLKEILPLFDTQKSDVPFAPSGGKKMLEETIAQCNG